MQAEVVRVCKAKFDEQLCRVYTRPVYQEYKKQYNNSTSFVIRPDPDPQMSNGWLVKHEQGGGSFCWAQHEFRVVADKDNGEYRCECKQWEHTGMRGSEKIFVKSSNCNFVGTQLQHVSYK